MEITKVPLKHINELQDLAQFDDAQHRGPHWYDYSVDPIDVASSLHSEKSETMYCIRTKYFVTISYPELSYSY